jgi:hypothetical protein
MGRLLAWAGLCISLDPASYDKRGLKKVALNSATLGCRICGRLKSNGVRFHQQINIQKM